MVFQLFARGLDPARTVRTDLGGLADVLLPRGLEPAEWSAYVRFGAPGADVPVKGFWSQASGSLEIRPEAADFVFVHGAEYDLAGRRTTPVVLLIRLFPGEVPPDLTGHAKAAARAAEDTRWADDRYPLHAPLIPEGWTMAEGDVYEAVATYNHTGFFSEPGGAEAWGGLKGQAAAVLLSNRPMNKRTARTIVQTVLDSLTPWPDWYFYFQALEAAEVARPLLVRRMRNWIRQVLENAGGPLVHARLPAHRGGLTVVSSGYGDPARESLYILARLGSIPPEQSEGEEGAQLRTEIWERIMDYYNPDLSYRFMGARRGPDGQWGFFQPHHGPEDPGPALSGGAAEVLAGHPWPFGPAECLAFLAVEARLAETPYIDFGAFLECRQAAAADLRAAGVITSPY